MASLSTKVKLYGEANSKTIDFTKDVHLQDDSDGNGPYIKDVERIRIGTANN